MLLQQSMSNSMLATFACIRHGALPVIPGWNQGGYCPQASRKIEHKHPLNGVVGFALDSFQLLQRSRCRRQYSSERRSRNGQWNGEQRLGPELKIGKQPVTAAGIKSEHGRSDHRERKATHPGNQGGVGLGLSLGPAHQSGSGSRGCCQRGLHL